MFEIAAVVLAAVTVITWRHHSWYHNAACVALVIVNTAFALS